MSSDLFDAFGGSAGAGWTEPQRPITQNTKNLSTPLNGEEDDDFGDFEIAEDEVDEADEDTEQKRKPVEVEDHSAFDQQAWGLDAESDNENNDSAHQDEEWGEYADNSVLFDAEKEKKSAKLEPKEVIESKPYNIDEKYDWEPVSFAQETLIPTQASTVSHAPSLEENITVSLSSASEKKILGPPPTNIPPPSLLLAFISSLFQTLPAQMKELLSGDALISNMSSGMGAENAQIFRKNMACIRASARVIAGRKLRWSRDSILSQSMSIGPAGHEGNKVTKINKSEARREDQEAEQAISIWKTQIGRLRNTVAKAKHQGVGPSLSVPQISDSLTVTRANEVDGAVAAPKCCFLCGVERNERVFKLDVSVDDSFGEWWRDHWGHVDCVIFWDECKNQLPHR